MSLVIGAVMTVGAVVGKVVGKVRVGVGVAACGAAAVAVIVIVHGKLMVFAEGQFALGASVQVTSRVGAVGGQAVMDGKVTVTVGVAA